MADQLQQLRDTLAADGYSIDITRDEGSATVRIEAADGVCDDCLVPKNVMVKGFLEPALGLNEAQIHLIYPADVVSTDATGPQASFSVVGQS